MKKHLLIVLLVLGVLRGIGTAADQLALDLTQPPPSARPWVFWFWINGNISREGITADLEAMKRVGVGGVLWMEVSGMSWAPDGKVTPLSPQWHEAMQWAIKECARLGLQFDISVDFGYGSGGPHITPELSMQQLVWSEKEVEGGQPVSVTLEKAGVPGKISAWLRPGAAINPKVVEMIETSDSYRDVAAIAIPVAASPAERNYRIHDVNAKAGLNWRLRSGKDVSKAPPPGAITPLERVVDLTSAMDRDGKLKWEAPPGKWLIIRYGHASNLKMTRPCPAAAVGLECDRLAKAGIEAHYGAFLKKIFEGADTALGKTLAFVHVDSWEAGCQNWTASFPTEFCSRRGYDLRLWLPVFTGRVIGSAEQSERFLWDVRATVGEMIHDNYAGRLRELAQPHGMKLSTEAYGNPCIDNLGYAGAGDFPISEFWAKGDDKFPQLPGGHYTLSSKAMASAAHTYGRPVVGAESFTSDRAWRDHPYTLKAMGDWAFCQGVNRMIFHLSAHQAYDNMIPGLTHRKWGEHFDRFNTWWDYSRPWMDYVSRCQYLLQQGEFASDVCYWFGEGAPLNVDDMALEMPAGYDYDLCTTELVRQMTVRDGRIVLPSGISYRYLRLPESDHMTLPMAGKIRELVEAGAHVIGDRKLTGSPSLADNPQADAEIERIAASLWDSNRVVSGRNLAQVFTHDGLKPDFEGEGLLYIHRRAGEADIYFVAHRQESSIERSCSFRVTGKRPELWDPQTGVIHPLPDFSETDGRITLPLHFDPMQSWFVIFRKNEGEVAEVHSSTVRRQLKNWPEVKPVMELPGPWQVSFDSKWGGPDKPLTFAALTDWSKHVDPGVRYYSGTAVYRKAFDFPELRTLSPGSCLLLNLGSLEVMARVKVNGKDCGIAWKPPYRVDITEAVRVGTNELEIDVVNLWINRMIGDEQLPEDSNWKDFETLAEWPEWFKSGQLRPSGRYTFTSCRHYRKDSPLVPSGLFGPVTLQAAER